MANARKMIDWLLLTAVAAMIAAGLLAMGLSAAGCGPVQVGPDDGPIVSAAAEVSAKMYADVSAEIAAVHIEKETVQTTVSSTSQPATAEGHTEARQTAGRDATVTAPTTTVNLSGSAWPIVAMVALLAAGALAVLYMRAKVVGESKVAEARSDFTMAAHNVDRARIEYERLEANALAVARAVSKLPAGSIDRNALLAMIGMSLPDRAAWDRLIKTNGLKVRRSYAAPGR